MQQTPPPASISHSSPAAPTPPTQRQHHTAGKGGGGGGGGGGESEWEREGVSSPPIIPFLSFEKNLKKKVPSFLSSSSSFFFLPFASHPLQKEEKCTNRFLCSLTQISTRSERRGEKRRGEE